MSSNMAPLSLEANGSKSGSPRTSKREKPLIVGIVILVILIVAFLIAVIVLAIKLSKGSSDSDDVCRTAACVETALDIMHSVNTSVDPCEDFYKYACGRWAIYNADRSNGGTAMAAITIEGLFRLHGYLTKAVNDESLPPSVRKIADAYVKCGTYGDMKEEDEAWLLDSLRDVGGWPMIDDTWEERRYSIEQNWPKVMHNFLVMTPVYITVEENIYDTSKRVIQISQVRIEEMFPIDKHRVLSIAKRLSEKDENSLESEFLRVEEFDQYLRKNSRLTGELQDDPTQTKVMTLRELKKMIPQINWTEFLNRVLGPYAGEWLSDTESVLVVGTDYLKQVFDSLFRGAFSKRTFANYLAVSVIQSFLDVNERLGTLSSLVSSRDPLKGIATPPGFSNGCFNFYTKMAAAATDFLNYRNRKAAMVDKKMISYFTSAMRDLIKEASWLDGTTRKRALEKLDETDFFIGFPRRYTDRNEVEKFFAGLPNLTSSVLQNQIIIRRHSYKRIVELLRKPSTRTEWPYGEGSQGSQVNAFHVQHKNLVVLPADLQVKPFFDVERPKYWNFGLYGWILGHEITHGYDTSGSKRDKYGNMRDWWKSQAKRQFDERAKCIIEQYNKIPYGYKDHYVNGSQTVGENVADNGGLRQAYIAYRKWVKDHGKEKRLPALEQYNTDQLFFLAVAQVYCAVPKSPEALYSFHFDDAHSPDQMRLYVLFAPNGVSIKRITATAEIKTHQEAVHIVNPAVANFDAFGKAFGCKSGSPMNPVKKCVVW